MCNYFGPPSGPRSEYLLLCPLVNLDCVCVCVCAGHPTNGSSIHKQQMQAGQQAVAASVIVAPEVKVPFSLAQVAVFLAVARTGSPTSASLACCISQPAVSKSLSGLEQVITLSSVLTAESPVCQGLYTLAHPSDLSLDKGLKLFSLFFWPDVGACEIVHVLP